MLSFRRILILCEDTKSSRDYLDRFHYDPSQVQIDCVGTGMNTDSLMEEAIQRKLKAVKNKEQFERIWVVFDKDDCSLQQFNRAFDLASSHGEIVPCWSNECFELWYLLHFCYRETGIGRSEINAELSRYLGKTYEKFDDSLFDQLSGKINTALKNADKLDFSNTGESRRGNPSTRVHELVNMLRALNPEKQKVED